MKSFYFLKHRRCLVLSIIWISLQSIAILYAQKNNVLLPDKTQYKTVQDNNLDQIKADTVLINELIDKAGILIDNRYYFDQDSVRYYTHKLISMSRQINYTHGEMVGYQILGWAYLYKDVADSSKYYFSQAIRVDKMERDTARLIWHSICLGWALLKEPDYDSAGLAFKWANKLAVQTSDTANLTLSVSQLARVYKMQGDMMMSAFYCLEMIRNAKENCDTNELITAYSFLSGLYSTMGVQDKRMEILWTILNLSRNMSNKRVLNRVNEIAISTYFGSGQYDSVLYYTRLTVPYYQRPGIVPLYLKTFGDVFLETNQIDSARYYYDLFYKNVLLTKMPLGSDTYLAMGRCEFKSGNQQKALEYYKLAEAELKKDDIFSKQEIYKVLSEYYDTNKDFESSLSYYKKYKILEDSVRRKRDAFNTGIFSVLTETEQMHGQIDALTRESQWQALLAGKQKQQKNILYGSAGILVLLGGLAFYRYRKGKELKSKQALLNERLRISRDLHDEVGATLGGIAMYSHLAKNQLEDGSPFALTKSLDTIQQSSAEMVVKLSDIVWLINPAHDSLKQLMEKLEDHAKRIATTKHTKVVFIIPKELKDISLPVESRRNIYLIFKEAIHNSMKYSQATIMEMKAHAFDHSLQFIWQDNGVGFDPTQIQKGNGLANMQKRAEDIEARLDLETTAFSGTKIILQCKVPH